MCILSFVPAEQDLSDEALTDLWNGGLCNTDGHGWAIAEGDHMILGRSLNLDEALTGFDDARKKYPSGPALFHSRWATHGSVRVDNVHPFLVGGSHQTVLAHNGILASDAHPKKGDDRSDTKILAEDILPKRWFRLDKPTVQTAIKKWCGTYNKLVILTVNPRYRFNAYIINEYQGHWDKSTGLWHSNMDYLGKPRWLTSYSTTPVRTKADEAREYEAQEALALEAGEDWRRQPGSCDFCYHVVNNDQVCVQCGTCQDCYEHEGDCQCHTKERTWSKSTR